MHTGSHIRNNAKETLYAECQKHYRVQSQTPYFRFTSYYNDGQSIYALNSAELALKHIEEHRTSLRRQVIAATQSGLLPFDLPITLFIIDRVSLVKLAKNIGAKTQGTTEEIVRSLINKNLNTATFIKFIHQINSFDLKRIVHRLRKHYSLEIKLNEPMIINRTKLCDFFDKQLCNSGIITSQQPTRVIREFLGYAYY